MRCGAGWTGKYCLGLELDDEGFDASVLTGFRERLVENDLERVIFDRLLDRVKELGLVRAGGRQRTDSTHVLARIRDLNRLELAGETVRAALEALSAAAPGWLAGVIDPSWQRVYGQRIDNWRLPEAETARKDLAVRYGRDGYWLLEQVYGPAAAGWLRGAACGAGAAAHLDPAVLPGWGEGDPAGGARARPPAGQRPPGLSL